MKSTFLKYSLSLISAIVINFLVLSYWITKCEMVTNNLESSFYCPGKEGYALGVHYDMWLSSIIIFIVIVILLLINWVIKNKEGWFYKFITKFIFGVGIIIFVVSHYLWIRADTFTEYKIKRVEGARYAEQQRQKYLESDEYKKQQEDEMRKNCEATRLKKLTNPNILMPTNCGGFILN